MSSSDSDSSDNEEEISDRLKRSSLDNSKMRQNTAEEVMLRENFNSESNEEMW